MSVDILLATYQGKTYLREQIDSILNQTYPDFKLLIRDDGSRDGTLDLLQTYDDPRIKWVSTQGHLGAKVNFVELMRQSRADYIFFSDQDDVWLPHKIATMLPHLKKNTPLLVHTDLTIVDDKLEILANSFWKWARLYPLKSTTLNRLVMQNVVTGCSMAINRSLLEKARPIPKAIVMHDWWLALVASCFGQVVPLSEPLVLYRQHGSNAIGAGSSRLQGRDSTPFENQAKAFLDIYGKELKAADREVLEAYLNLKKLSYFKRCRSIVHHGLYKQGLLRNIKLFLS